MSAILKRLGNAMVAAIGFLLGKWLWEEVLKPKFQELKKRLTKH